MSEELNADKQAEGLPRSQVIGLILGAAFLLATIILPPPETMAAEAWAALGLMLLMATWWSTEAIPIPATPWVSPQTLPVPRHCLAANRAGSRARARDGW